MFKPKELQSIIEGITEIQTDEFAFRLAQSSMENYMRDVLIMRLQKKIGTKNPNELVIPEWDRYDISIHSSYQLRNNPSLVIELKWSTVGFALMGHPIDFLDKEIKKDVDGLLELSVASPKYQIFFMRHPQTLPGSNYSTFIKGYDHHEKGFSILKDYNVTNRSSYSFEQLLHLKMEGYYKNLDPRINVDIFQIPSGEVLGTDWSIYVTIATIP
ncbi:hypothetical protein [Bacillus sp. FJAT-29937]|uniref:hypothetical protein n=1 Tax=Bacillus sp. FJAT-29937 TaxID=1720553 RepID=UPI0008310EE6|nr:hypothetical protein [Bacillus sp. FJAT-29937]